MDELTPEQVAAKAAQLKQHVDAAQALAEQLAQQDPGHKDKAEALRRLNVVRGVVQRI